MKAFVNSDSIVRKIWGNADTILFIFAGASAEFALNKAVDWLYFTGKLPADPLGRLFSTVAYARMIVFTEYNNALKAIDQITAIHKNVENARGQQIPDWAYRDVLFMLIDYSIRSYEVLERKLSETEKGEVFDVFCRVGIRMGIEGLPTSYGTWKVMREQHLADDMRRSLYSVDLFKQYRKHLGFVRYHLLKQVQAMIAPDRVRELLRLSKPLLLPPVLGLYKLSRKLGMDAVLKEAILPPGYKQQIKELNIPES